MFNRVGRYRSNQFNKLLDKQYKKIARDFIVRDDDSWKGINSEIYNLYQNCYLIEENDSKIDPLESRLHDKRMDAEIRKVLDTHEDLFKRLAIDD